MSQNSIYYDGPRTRLCVDRPPARRCWSIAYLCCHRSCSKGAEAVVHCFGVPLAGAVILAERESIALLRLCAFLDSWLMKGFYIILCVSQTLEKSNTPAQYSLPFLFFGLGMLCFNSIFACLLSKSALGYGCIALQELGRERGI